MSSEGKKGHHISVVVCTKDRPDDLRKCLASLKKLSPPPHEILLVDNNDATSDQVRLMATRFPLIRYIREQKPGLSVARNTAIRHARGQMILFTDDDVQVDPHWVGQIQRNFDDPALWAVTGLVLPSEANTEAQIIFEKNLGGFGRGLQPMDFTPSLFKKRNRWGFPAWEMGAGANMAFRRDVFEKVGYFDKRLGAGAAGCSEDSEMWYRILSNGGTCRYDPKAVVYHRHRKTMAALKRQMKAYMRGHVAALLIQFHRHRHWGNLRRLCILLPRYYARLLLMGAFHGYKGRYRLLPHEIAGCLSGIRFYLLNRKSG